MARGEDRPHLGPFSQDAVVNEEPQFVAAGSRRRLEYLIVKETVMAGAQILLAAYPAGRARFQEVLCPLWPAVTLPI